MLVAEPLKSIILVEPVSMQDHSMVDIRRKQTRHQTPNAARNVRAYAVQKLALLAAQN